MKQWNASIASLVVMICAGVAFVAPQYACGQSSDAQASEAVSGVVKKHAPVAGRKKAHERHANKVPTIDKKGDGHQQADSGFDHPILTTTAPKAKKEQSHSKKIEVDIKTLETRLKNTDAIGFFTKLAIRSNIIDLMNKIKQYRKKSMLKAKIKEIRTSYDGLILKIVALLEEDPKLSRDLYVGRESIWESLLEVKA